MNCGLSGAWNVMQRYEETSCQFIKKQKRTKKTVEETHRSITHGSSQSGKAAHHTTPAPRHPAKGRTVDTGGGSASRCRGAGAGVGVRERIGRAQRTSGVAKRFRVSRDGGHAVLRPGQHSQSVRHPEGTRPNRGLWVTAPCPRGSSAETQASRCGGASVTGTPCPGTQGVWRSPCGSHSGLL